MNPLIALPALLLKYPDHDRGLLRALLLQIFVQTVLLTLTLVLTKEEKTNKGGEKKFFIRTQKKNILIPYVLFVGSRYSRGRKRNCYGWKFNGIKVHMQVLDKCTRTPP